jgi:hypothetical protein
MTTWARRVPATTALTALLFTTVFAEFLRVQPRSDLTIHLAYALRIHSLASIESPHFLLELLVKLLIAIGLAPSFAMALLLGSCYGGMAILISHELDRRAVQLRPAMHVLFVLTVLVASHIFLFTLPQRNMYHGYFVPVVYHNPTQQLCKLFALWIWFRFCADFVEGEHPSWRRVWCTGLLCVLSAIAKPSFLIAFVPVVGVTAAIRLLRGRWRDVLQLTAGVALPSVVVLLWQAHVAYGAVASEELLFAPFAVFDARTTIWKLPLSVAFPLVVAAMALITWRVPPRLRYLGGFAAIALFMTLCLAEAGRISAGNFAWTGQTAVFLAYVESALFLVSRPWPKPWRYAGWSVYAVHVACGLIWGGAVFFPQRVEFL